MELTVLDNKGKQAGTVQMDEKSIAADASKALLHEIVVAHLASQRSGTHKSKTRSEVSGGGLKPWRQKGTGRARSGSTRSPLWRKGGIIFGPRERDYTQTLPKQKRKIAFKMAVQHLISEKALQVVEPVSVKEPKTKFVADVYKKWDAPAESLLVVDKIDATFERASRNIANVVVIDVASLNTYQCLRAKKVFITKPAFEQLQSRLAGSAE